MSADPDRDCAHVFDPDEHPRLVEEHPREDPDRHLPPGRGQSLPDLLGEERTHAGERDSYQWAFGLIGVFLFLALVAFLFGEVLTP